MEQYERTELEIIKFTTEDTIITSEPDGIPRDPYEGGAAG